MRLGRSKAGTGHGARPWPVLLLLLVVVLLPTLGVLWFMSQAVGNERLAMRQKLSDVYRTQLVGLQQELQLEWQARSRALDAQDPDVAGSRIFAERVRGGLADGIVVYDATGRLAYPAPVEMQGAGLQQQSGSWRDAERLERSGQSDAAALRYAEIARQTADRDLAARAFLAQARCLLQLQRTEAALSILTDQLSRPEYARSVDSQGRLIAPNAQLRALQVLGEIADPRSPRIAAALRKRLIDYDDPSLPAAQRRFLMKQMLAEPAGPEGALPAPQAVSFDTLAAEELAARYLDSDPPAPPSTSLRPSGLPEVWHLASPSGTVVALFHQNRLVEDLESLIGRQSFPETTTVELLAPGVKPEGLFLVSLPVGGFLQDWQLVLRPEDQELFTTAANQRINAYLLTGALVVLAIVVLALLVARVITRQLRLTRLKNDLLATVSHELRTPLSSMRLLVDTLLETGVQDSQRVREYLGLIAKENARLSRLVENFLTFSRMEQKSHGFEKKAVSAGSVVKAAAALVSDRLNAPGSRFVVEVAPELPTLVADHDALVTVLLNLLDNAYKYSEEDKHIVLSGTSENGHVCFAVEDNGIGLSSVAAGRIFDRFYQVDRTLSRPGSGCGLGLAIVQYIVDAHGGSVDVASRPGEGSTFTVRLPAALKEPGSSIENEPRGTESNGR